MCHILVNVRNRLNKQSSPVHVFHYVANDKKYTLFVVDITPNKLLELGTSVNISECYVINIDIHCWCNILWYVHSTDVITSASKWPHRSQQCRHKHDYQIRIYLFSIQESLGASN